MCACPRTRVKTEEHVNHKETATTVSVNQDTKERTVTKVRYVNSAAQYLIVLVEKG